MNRGMIYSIIGVTAAAIIIFIFPGNGSFSRITIEGDKIKQTTTIPTAAATTVAPIDIKVKNVVTNTTNDNKTVDIRVAFDVHNPNTNTMILDGIRYNVCVNNMFMTSGNIGTEAPEDVIRSQQGFPIIGNSTVTLKDMQAIQQNNMNAESLDKMVHGKVSYVIKGTYSYRQTADLQTSGGVTEFTLTFP